MGVYLAFPMKGKKSSSGENNLLTFATSETQGWRNSMEDTHIAQINLPNNIQVFGVFDGHGGSEVSLFCEKHFLEELTKNKNFINFNFEPALKETFL